MYCIFITGPPIFLTHPTSHIVTVGMNVTLYCNVSAFKVSFAWDVNTNGSKWNRIDESQKYKYIVRNIQQPQQYRCIAGNHAGTFTSNTATIEVLNKYVQFCTYHINLMYVINDLILEIITHPQNKQVTFGSSFALTCTSSLSSNVTFSWTHNGTVIKTQSTVDGDTSRLTISNVRYRDGGSYVCIVRSGSLSVISNTAIITIYGKPNCVYENN